ncbi:MAG: hypothetical protein ACRYFS_21925 [Janthinobacterium lividum]
MTDEEIIERLWEMNSKLRIMAMRMKDQVAQQNSLSNDPDPVPVSSLALPVAEPSLRRKKSVHCRFRYRM